jgi:hypothetical protein
MEKQSKDKPQNTPMTLRRRNKGIENLRLANVRDYIITEDEGEHSPFTVLPQAHRGRLFPRRVHADTTADITASFEKFSWQRAKVDGLVLCEYRRFMDAMMIPTTEAMRPWVEFVERHLGWEGVWILENPVAAKREMVRKFEGTAESKGLDLMHAKSVLDPREESPNLRESGSKESLENMRRGAMARIGFRDEPPSKPKPRSLRFRFSGPAKSRIPIISNENKENAQGGRREIERPTSSMGFRDVKGLKTQIVALKKKALSNPWHRKSKNM